MSNTYGDEAVKNNEKISEIISSNYSYIDLDDIDIVDQFIKNYSRLKIEYQGQRRLPLQVTKIVGSISILQADFKNKMKEKFKSKKLELTEPSFFSVRFLKINKAMCTSVCKLRVK
jgi:hypothetical protein